MMMMLLLLVAGDGGGGVGGGGVGGGGGGGVGAVGAGAVQPWIQATSHLTPRDAESFRRLEPFRYLDICIAHLKIQSPQLHGGRGCCAVVDRCDSADTSQR